MHFLEQWVSRRGLDDQLRDITQLVISDNISDAMTRLSEFERLLHFLLLQFPSNTSLAALVSEEEVIHHLLAVKHIKEKLLQ